MVRMERLELSRREAHEPKSCMSTIPSHPHLLERVRRIELLSSDWKSVILPLYYTRFIMVLPHRIELRIDDYKSTVIPFNYRSGIIFLLYKLDKNHYDPIQIYIQDIY